MELSKEQISRYSELFHQPIDVVEGVALSCNDTKDIERILYKFGETEDSEQDFTDEELEEIEDFIEPDEDEQNMSEHLKNVLKNLSTDINKKIMEKLGITADVFDASAKVIKVNPKIFDHFCPFTEEQRATFNCKMCPMHSENFIPAVIRYSIDNDITITEAAEYMKFHSYRNYQSLYDNIIKKRIQDEFNNNVS